MDSPPSWTVIGIGSSRVLRSETRALGILVDSFAHKRRLVWVVNLRLGLVVEEAAVIGFEERVNITSILSLHIVTDRLRPAHSLIYRISPKRTLNPQQPACVVTVIDTVWCHPW